MTDNMLCEFCKPVPFKPPELNLRRPDLDNRELSGDKKGVQENKEDCKKNIKYHLSGINHPP
jgi:hypothetical protein